MSQAEAYGSTFADVYDEWYDERLDPAGTVQFIAELAGNGNVLELGIGTGRVAIPLTARGVEVEGVEASPEMIARLRAKPGGEHIPVHAGSFSAFDLDRTFEVVCIPFSSLFLLPSQSEQVRCFESVARHLRPGGRFVLDAFVPDGSRYVNGQSVSLEEASSGTVRLEVARHHSAEQRIEATRVVLSEAGVRLFPLSLRYATPAELDLMALHAGLRLTDRFGDYDRRPFEDRSPIHVSVYRLAG